MYRYVLSYYTHTPKACWVSLPINSELKTKEALLTQFREKAFNHNIDERVRLEKMKEKWSGVPEWHPNFIFYSHTLNINDFFSENLLINPHILTVDEWFNQGK